MKLIINCTDFRSLDGNYYESLLEQGGIVWFLVFARQALCTPLQLFKKLLLQRYLPRRKKGKSTENVKWL
jgi:hypothetical protein